MDNKFDTVVVGAGIAGLLTALRLSGGGQKVLVIEKNKIGSGSTFSSHGMIHSGALYVQHHGHIVKNCQEAQKAYSTLLGDAEIPCEPSVYIAAKNSMSDFVKHLDMYGFDHEPIAINKVPELNQKMVRDYEMLTLKERVFSPEMILKLVTSYCLAKNVRFVLGAGFPRIASKNGKIVGIKIGLNELLACKNVVIASGLGTMQVLQSFNSAYCEFLKSRLDMMVSFPNSELQRGIIFAELDKPILMPAKNNSVLGSLFGGIQPPIGGERSFSVDFDKAKLLYEMVKLLFNDKILNVGGSQFFMAGKTDYVGDANTEKGFINPGYHIINHGDLDKISGLYTVITGKMTLAFHASKSVSELILKDRLNLIINPANKTKSPKQMFTVEPWVKPGKID
jgi:hypothetical protein